VVAAAAAGSDTVGDGGGGGGGCGNGGGTPGHTAAAVHGGFCPVVTVLVDRVKLDFLSQIESFEHVRCPNQ
jgi:hypothetical protein